MPTNVPVMSTTKAAGFLCERRDEDPDMHMGNFLNKLSGHKLQKEIGATHLQPLVGSYLAHEFSTSPGSHPMSHFDAKWAQEGTRPSKDGKGPRWICGFTESGPANRLHEEGIDLNDTSTRRKYFWRTEAPPELPESCTGLQTWHVTSGHELCEEPWRQHEVHPKASILRPCGKKRGQRVLLMILHLVLAR